MRRLYAFIMLLAVALSTWAFELGDLAYDNYNSSTKTVTCTGLSTAGMAKTNLSLVVPEAIYYNGSTCTVRDIKVNAFGGCTNIRTAEIKASSIGTLAFQACTSLNKITLGPKVTTIAYNAFTGCSGMASIYVDDTNPNFSAYKYALMDKAQTKLIYVPENGSLAPSGLPKTCTAIERGAYMGNRNITNAYVPYGITSIGAMAFYGCPKLTLVDLPSSVYELGGNCFMRSNALNEFWYNRAFPPKIDKSTMFSSVSNIALNVQRGRSGTYKTNGWTGFKSYNDSDSAIVPYDCAVNTLCFTVTSTKPEEIHGKQYDGRAMVVRGKWNNTITWGSATVPPSITIRGKEYAVTLIGGYAFNLNVEYELRNCENVDSVGACAFYKQRVTSAELPNVMYIGEDAFRQSSIQTINLPNVKYIEKGAFMQTLIQTINLPNIVRIEADAFRQSKLNTITWGPNLRALRSRALMDCPIEHDIIFPYRFNALGSEALSGTLTKYVLIPSSLINHSDGMLAGLSKAEYIVVNSDTYYTHASDKDYFTGTNKYCTLYFPAIIAEKCKTRPELQYFTKIKAGAYDFARQGNPFATYKMTVVDRDPVEYGGVKYDGKAAYVYTEDMALNGGSTYTTQNFEIDYNCGVNRKYLMTQIGDSCFARTKYTKVNFDKMEHLEKIGRKAFNHCDNITSVDMRAERVYMDHLAFSDCPKLTRVLNIGHSVAERDTFPIYDNNAPGFKFYAWDCEYLHEPSYVSHTNMKQEYYDAMGICFEAKGNTYSLYPGVPLDFGAKGIKAYAITSYNKTTHVLTTKRVEQTEKYDGFILTDLTPGQVYTIDQTTHPVSAYGMLHCYATSIFNDENNYVWDDINNVFVPVKQGHNLGLHPGNAFLHFNTNQRAAKLFLDIFAPSNGDVNRDGSVDVTDVNVAINVMLGKAYKVDYPLADVNGDGTIDVTDVNLIINVMLGK